MWSPLRWRREDAGIRRGWWVDRRFLVPMATVGSITLVVKLATVANELVVAYRFGTSDELDAFLIAFLLPSFAINVVAGSFGPALIPSYIEVREHRGVAAAQRLFSRVMMSVLALLMTVSAVLSLTASWILPVLGSGFGEGKLELTRSLFFVLLPVLVVSGVATMWAAVLNADERFVLPALAPIVTPAVTLAVLVLAGEAWGIYALAVGTVGGFVMEAGVLAWGLSRRKAPLIPRWLGPDPTARGVAGQYVPMVVGSFLMSGTSLVERSLGATLGPGSVAALGYGNKAVAFFVGIASAALSAAIFPHFSRMVAVGEWAALRRMVRNYARLILLVTVPPTVLLVYFSTPLVRLIFQRGAFSSSDADLVGTVQAFYLLHVPFYVLTTLFVRLVSSLKANHLLMLVAMANLCATVVLGLTLMRWLGVAGIALSTSVVYALSCMACWAFLRTRLPSLEKNGGTHTV